MFSTLLLAGLAIVIALIPLAIRVVDRATVTRVVVVAADAALAQRAVGVMDGFLNAQLDSTGAEQKTFLFERRTTATRPSTR